MALLGLGISCLTIKEQASSYVTAGMRLQLHFIQEHFTSLNLVRSWFHQSWHCGAAEGLGAIRAELQRKCFNTCHQLYSFGSGKNGQRFAWSSNVY